MMPLKRVLNSKEEQTNDQLTKICSTWSARVFPKMRVADILPIEHSGISQSDFEFALRAHFDFVVTDHKSDPLFVVEFDGPTHSSDIQRSRDGAKDRLSQTFGCPLLRINSKFLKQIGRASCRERG